MAKLIPWRPWMTESHAQPMDTHSSWAFLANSAATTALCLQGATVLFPMAQPRANSYFLNPHSIPGSTEEQVLFIAMLLHLTGPEI